MMSIADLLAESPFFVGLPSVSLDLLAGCGRNVHFSAGDRILSEGESADEFFVLRHGRVALEIDSPRQGPLVIETLRPGEIVGVSWLLPPYRWTLDARALDDCRAISLDARCLRAKCDDDHDLGYELFKRFAGLIRSRLQATRLQLIDLYRAGAS